MAEDRPIGTPRDIGRRIVQLRISMGFDKPTGFARFLDIETNTLSNYETGIRRPNLEFAARICSRTGITLDWLYWGVMSGLPVHVAEKLLSVDAEDLRRAIAG